MPPFQQDDTAAPGTYLGGGVMVPPAAPPTPPPQPAPDQVIMLDGEEHRFPADFSQAEIRKALEALPPPKSKDETTKDKTKDDTTKKPPAAMPTSWTDWAVNTLPYVGGAAGGLIGAAGGTVLGMGVGGVPGGIGGAAVGGAGGEAAKELINRYRSQGLYGVTGGYLGTPTAPSPTGPAVPATPVEAAKNIGTQAGINAATEGAGAAVGAGLKAAAVPVMRMAVGKSLQADIARIMVNKNWWLNRNSITELDDLLATPTANFARPQLEATRQAMAKAWQSQSWLKGAAEGGVLGGILGHSPMSATLGALTVSAARNPVLQSLLAHGMYNAAGYISGISPQAIRLALLAYQNQGGGSTTPQPSQPAAPQGNQ